jgi:hypothetical protein
MERCRQHPGGRIIDTKLMSSIAIQQVHSREPFRSKFGRWSERFIFSAGSLLLITGSAKIVSAFGKAKVLNMIDPILRISFGHLMLIVGILEIVISLFCLLTKRHYLCLCLVAWLGTCFLVHRLGLLWISYQEPCHCLGSLTDALHISQQTADSIAKIILAYLLFGSYFFLLNPRKHINKLEDNSHPSTT